MFKSRNCFESFQYKITYGWHFLHFYKKRASFTKKWEVSTFVYILFFIKKCHYQRTSNIVLTSRNKNIQTQPWHTTSATSYRRRIDVETTSCVYWDWKVLRKNIFAQQQVRCSKFYLWKIPLKELIVICRPATCNFIMKELLHT